MTSIRSPIVSVLGHVDHGKSSLLDAIRDTNILSTEAGAITQAIGASIVPVEVIRKKCGNLLEQLKLQLTIPGLLFIDTPGHAAFSSLRKRGGSLADIAIVVIDINEGFKPQTIEAIEILRASKTPFIIAANKIDNLASFRLEGMSGQSGSKSILGLLQDQEARTIQDFETKLYNVVGKLHENFNLVSERFDRVQDFTKEVAIIPITALKRKGLAEILMVLSALAQKFLENNLHFSVDGPAKATILEVKEEQGLGKTMDVILYNGTLRVNDPIVIGGLDKPIVTRVRALFEPAPLSEMRDKKSQYTSVKQAVAATGVKISCPDLDKVLSGMPILSFVKGEEEAAKEHVQATIEEANVQTEKEGIVIKADNIGSLEALSVLLREQNIPIRKASVGPISKKDVADAESGYGQEPLHSVILGFNIKQEPSSKKVKIITSGIIYDLIDQYDAWKKEEEQKLIAEKLQGLTKPAKMEILQNCIFRQSNPCVAGVEILQGTLTTNTSLIKASGDKASYVKEIQLNKKNVTTIDKGEQVAISIPNITGGRQVHEGDILYTDISPIEYREFKKYSNLLSPEEKELLKEIAEIKRKQDPIWGK